MRVPAARRTGAPRGVIERLLVGEPTCTGGSPNVHEGPGVPGGLPLQGQLTPRCKLAIAGGSRAGAGRRGAC